MPLVVTSNDPGRSLGVTGACSCERARVGGLGQPASEDGAAPNNDHHFFRTFGPGLPGTPPVWFGRVPTRVGFVSNAALVLESLVLLYGFPGVGKSTVAPAIAEELRLPRLAKDTIKEAMWDATRRPFSVPALAWSRRLGAAAYEAMFRLARELGPALLIEAPLDPARHGAVLLELTPRPPIELFVWARPELVFERHRARLPTQHACHRPHPLPSMGQVEGGLRSTRPLRLGGPLLEIDLSDPCDTTGVADWVRSHL